MHFKPEFNPIIESLQEKLNQGTCKQLKEAKICAASTRWELKCEKCSKAFCRLFGRQNMQSQTLQNAKHYSNPKDIFVSAKNVLEKLNTEEDSSKTTISKVLS